MFPIGTSVPVNVAPGAVIGLMVANIVMFLVQCALPPDLYDRFVLSNALVPARYGFPWATVALTLPREGVQPFFTNTFMHADLWRLLTNMWALWVYGSALEQRPGAICLILVYLVAGVVGRIVHYLTHSGSSVTALGASAGIAGVLAAFVAANPSAKIRAILIVPPLVVPCSALTFIVVWFGIQGVMGTGELMVGPKAAGGIAWWAHLGGFLAGLALGLALTAIKQRAVREVGPLRLGIREFGLDRRPIKTSAQSRDKRAPAASSGTKARAAIPATSTSTPKSRQTIAGVPGGPWGRKVG